MALGFVYVMINPAHRDLVKIGGTERDPEQRAMELSSTGVPFEFVVVHSERVSDWSKVERLVHGKLRTARAAPNREFFRVTVREAIAAIIEISGPFLLAEPSADPDRSQGGITTPAIDYSGFHTVHRAVVTCHSCHIDYSVTLRRYETKVRCPSCRTTQESDVRWE
jgi:hypothetical protein